MAVTCIPTKPETAAKPIDTVEMIRQIKERNSLRHFELPPEQLERKSQENMARFIERMEGRVTIITKPM